MSFEHDEHKTLKLKTLLKKASSELIELLKYFLTEVAVNCQNRPQKPIYLVEEGLLNEDV